MFNRQHENPNLSKLMQLLLVALYKYKIKYVLISSLNIDFFSQSKCILFRSVKCG